MRGIKRTRADVEKEDAPDTVFMDIETTGLEISAKIIEIALVSVNADGSIVDSRQMYINPECHIPANATDIHGITDDMVKDVPPFRQVARDILSFIGDKTIAGYNIRKFDIPILLRELASCGLQLSLSRNIIDVIDMYR